jgi:hypothetical protein
LEEIRNTRHFAAARYPDDVAADPVLFHLFPFESREQPSFMAWPAQPMKENTRLTTPSATLARTGCLQRTAHALAQYAAAWGRLATRMDESFIPTLAPILESVQTFGPRVERRGCQVRIA